MRPDTREIAPLKKDLDLFLGWGKYFPNPDEVLQRRGGGLGIKLYEQVARDPHAGAVLRSRKLAAAGLDWEVLSASDEPLDVEVADFVGAELEAAKLRRVNHALLSAILKGYAVGEIIWRRRDDGRIGIAKIKARGQHRFLFDPDGNLRLLTQENMTEGVELPPRKFITFAWGVDDDNPYGEGLGRSLYWPVWFKKNGLKFWLIFCEKFGSPTVVGKYPPGASPDQQNALLEAIKSIQQETGVKIPDTMTLDLLEAQRQGAMNNYESLLKYLDASISKLVKGETLTTEVGDKGSYAASKTHGEVRQEILEADAADLEDVHNEQTIPWLCDYNWPTLPNGYPKLKIRAEPPEDLNAEADRDLKVIRGFRLRVAKRWAHTKYNLPEATAGEELVAASEEPEPTPPGGQPPAMFSERPEDALVAHVRTQERLEKRLIERARPLYAAYAERVLARVANHRQGRELPADDELPRGLAPLLAQGMAAALEVGRRHAVADMEAALKRAKANFAEDEELVVPELALEFFRERAFTLARHEDELLLARLKAALERILAEGGTLADWRRQAEAILRSSGFAPLDSWRAENVFRTNMVTAYQAGRWQEMARPELAAAFPMFQYHAVMDSRTTPFCAALNGFLAPREDSVWRKIWPPNHFACRSTVTAVSIYEIEERGLAATPYPREQIDEQTGEIIVMPPEPAKGFDKSPAAELGLWQ